MQLEEAVVHRIVSTLQKEKFIDDYRFTRSFINDKLRFGKWGKTKIEYALRQKLIPGEIIREAFLEFPDGLLTQSLRSLLERKLKSVKGNSECEKRAKVIRFGLSRGFPMQDVLKCLDQIPEEG